MAIIGNIPNIFRQTHMFSKVCSPLACTPGNDSASRRGLRALQQCHESLRHGLWQALEWAMRRNPLGIWMVLGISQDGWMGWCENVQDTSMYSFIVGRKKIWFSCRGPLKFKLSMENFFATTERKKKKRWLHCGDPLLESKGRQA